MTPILQGVGKSLMDPKSVPMRRLTGGRSHSKEIASCHLEQRGIHVLAVHEIMTALATNPVSLGASYLYNTHRSHASLERPVTGLQIAGVLAYAYE